MPLAVSESSGITVQGSPTVGAELGYRHSAFIGSCKHQVWQAIRASSAAPYYLDDFSDGNLSCTCGNILVIRILMIKVSTWILPLSWF